MAILLALLIFAALSAGCWFVSVACYRSTFAGPDPAAARDYGAKAALAVGAATLATAVPFPTGYALSLVAWAVGAFCGLGLSAGRAAVLFLYLAASSFIARLALRGVLDMFGR